MKYQQQILDAFDSLGFSPRGNQLEDIHKIIIAFLDEGYKNVVLSAPTGVGKSLIGAVVSEVIHQIKAPYTPASASFLLSPTNLLSEQYFNTFQKGRDDFDNTFRVLKGANNFECGALSTDSEPQTAESCSYFLFQKNGMTSIVDSYCNSCKYQRQKMFRDKTRHLITNYSYFFTDRLLAQQLANRTITVYDEAHLINDIFTEHTAISFSDSSLKRISEELVNSLSLGTSPLFKQIKTLRDHLVSGMINEDTYVEYMEQFVTLFMDISEEASKQCEKAFKTPKIYLTLAKLSKKYQNHANKIGDFLEHQFPHAFEYKESDPKNKTEDSISIKAIFVGDMFEGMRNSEYNLLMSGTIDEEFVKTTLNMKDFKFIRLPPVFKKENKKFVFYKPQFLSYTTLQQESVLGKLQDNCFDIVKHHSDKNERGIILTPSFVINQKIVSGLLERGCNIKIFEHQKGQKMADLIPLFKNYSGNCILVTPSGFEGLDLADEYSRFQILLKAPYASLGESRMKKIVQHFPEIYQKLCLMKIIQGAGRSVRGPDDYAVTYALDTNIQKLFTPNMQWRDEFEISYQSQLFDV